MRNVCTTGLGDRSAELMANDTMTDPVVRLAGMMLEGCTMAQVARSEGLTESAYTMDLADRSVELMENGSMMARADSSAG